MSDSNVQIEEVYKRGIIFPNLLEHSITEG